MVGSYGVTLAENDGVLKFVIKLDECEVIKMQKMERITITLMNRALSPILNSFGNIDKNDPRYFNVQLENHVY